MNLLIADLNSDDGIVVSSLREANYTKQHINLFELSLPVERGRKQHPIMLHSCGHSKSRDLQNGKFKTTTGSLVRLDGMQLPALLHAQRCLSNLNSRLAEVKRVQDKIT